MIEIKQSTACGKIIVPPSKSYAHRLLIAAALTNKTCKVENVEISNDIHATINCLETLGKKISIKNKVHMTLLYKKGVSINETGSRNKF